MPRIKMKAKVAVNRFWSYICKQGSIKPNKNHLIMEKRQVTLDEMRITQEGGYFLNQAASWATFISIMGFIALGLVVLSYFIGALTMGGIQSQMQAQMMMEGMSMPMSPAMMFSWLGFIIALIVCAIAAIPYIYQYCFARKVKKAYAGKDLETLAQSFRSLKNYYVFTGIILIIALIIMVLSFISLLFMPMM